MAEYNYPMRGVNPPGTEDFMEWGGGYSSTTPPSYPLEKPGQMRSLNNTPNMQDLLASQSRKQYPDNVSSQLDKGLLSSLQNIPEAKLRQMFYMANQESTRNDPEQADMLADHATTAPLSQLLDSLYKNLIFSAPSTEM